MNDSTMTLEGRVALVTGAGNGIGREVAFTLASAGAAVCCVDLDRDAVEAVAATIRQQGGRALALIADVASEETWTGSTKTAQESWGRFRFWSTTPAFNTSARWRSSRSRSGTG